MPARNSPTTYGAVSQFLHWAVVVLLIVQITLARIAHELPLGLDKLAVLARHKSFGITILGLAVIRLVWRLFNPPPAPPPMPRWQLAAARLNHVLLYAFLFLMPLTGWMMSSASNYPVSWFGLVQLPDLVGPDPDLKQQFRDIHGLFARILIGLALLHIAAALKHQFLDRDGLLWRMLPWRAR